MSVSVADRGLMDDLCEGAGEPAVHPGRTVTIDVMNGGEQSRSL